MSEQQSIGGVGNNLSITSADYAGFWKRVAATIIDFILVSILFFLLDLALGYNPFVEIGKVMQNAKPGQQPNIPPAPAIVSIVNLVGTWLYYAVFESSKFRGTPGKIALGIVTSNKNGAALDFGTASLRYALRLLFSIAALAPVPMLVAVSSVASVVDALLVAFTARSQALHDMLAGTLVLNKNLESENL